MIELRLSGAYVYISRGRLRFSFARQINLYFASITCYHESVTVYVALQTDLAMKACRFV